MKTVRWLQKPENCYPAMYNSAINGKGSMPPRGGNTKLTDAKVKAAVDFMIGAVGGWPSE